MRKLLFILVSLLVSLPSLMAQHDMAEIKQRVTDAQKKLYGTTLDFVQTKHSPLLKEDAVSHGTLTIYGDNNIRWQYTEPTDLAFVVNGDSTYTISNGKRNDLSGSSGRMTRGIAQLISALATGDELFNDKIFDCVIDNDKCQITLTPKRRDMKRLMQSIMLSFDKQTYIIQSVRIFEKQDSNTLIVFSLR